MSILIPSISELPHHSKQEICATRAKYREGRRDTAVKVYTINQESCYLLIQNVPSVGGTKEELENLCKQYGYVNDIYPVDDYPCEEFTEVYLVKYSSFPAARTAKKLLDDYSFFGGILHVCYAPEFETVHDTRNKLIERRKYIASRIKSFSQENETDMSTDIRKRKYYDKEHTSDSTKKKKNESIQYTTYIWAGKEYTVPVNSSEHFVTESSHKCCTESDPNCSESEHQTNSHFFLPRQLIKNQTLTTKDSSQNKQIEKISDDNDKLDISSNDNGKTSNYSYEKTMDSIRQKMLSFSTANLSVNLKGKKS